MFPPEIVQLIVDELGESDLQQFLSVSNAFRYSVSKLLFNRIRLHAYPRPEFPHPSSHLLDIFSNNQAALYAVRVVELILPPEEPEVDSDDSYDDEEKWSVARCIVHQGNNTGDCPGARDPNLAAVISLIATVPVEALMISARGRFFDMGNLSLKEIDALVALRSCPSLTTLSLDDLFSVPPPVVFGIPSKDHLSSMELGHAEWSYPQHQTYVKGDAPPCVCDMDVHHQPPFRQCSNCLPSIIQAHAELKGNIPVLPQLQNLKLKGPSESVQCLSPPVDLDLDYEVIAKYFSYPIPRLKVLHITSPVYVNGLSMDDYRAIGHLLKRTPSLESFYFIDNSIGELYGTFFPLVFAFNDEGTSPLQPLGSYPRLRELRLGDRDCSLENDGIRSIALLFYCLQPLSGPLEHIELEFHWIVETSEEASYAFDVENAWDELRGALGRVQTLKSLHVHVEVRFSQGFPQVEFEDAVDTLRAASEAAVESLGHEGLEPSNSSYFSILHSG